MSTQKGYTRVGQASVLQLMDENKNVFFAKNTLAYRKQLYNTGLCRERFVSPTFHLGVRVQIFNLKGSSHKQFWSAFGIQCTIMKSKTTMHSSVGQLNTQTSKRILKSHAEISRVNEPRDQYSVFPQSENIFLVISAKRGKGRNIDLKEYN